jgi:hypothetical protein
LTIFETLGNVQKPSQTPAVEKTENKVAKVENEDELVFEFPRVVKNHVTSK